MPDRLIKVGAASFRQQRSIESGEVDAEVFRSDPAARKQPYHGQCEIHEDRNGDKEYRCGAQQMPELQGNYGRLLARDEIVVRETNIVQMNASKIQQSANPDHHKPHGQIGHF